MAIYVDVRPKIDVSDIANKVRDSVILGLLTSARDLLGHDNVVATDLINEAIAEVGSAPATESSNGA